MAATHQITCDGCDADLTYTGNCEDYRLVLGNENKPTFPGAGAVTAMGIYPPIDRTHHFCDLRCLDYWRDRERHSNKALREQSDKWKELHGTKDADGRIRSWPSTPQDILDTWRTEAKEAALSAFPMKRPNDH